VWPLICKAKGWTDPWLTDDAACQKYLDDLPRNPVTVRREFIIRMGAWFDWSKVMSTELENLPTVLLFMIFYAIFSGTHRRAWEIFGDALDGGAFGDVAAAGHLRGGAAFVASAESDGVEADQGAGAGAAAAAAPATSVTEQELAAGKKKTLDERVKKLKQKSRDVMSHVLEVASDPVIPKYAAMVTSGLQVVGREHGLVMRLMHNPGDVRQVYSRWADFGWRKTCVDLFSVLRSPEKMAAAGLTVAWARSCEVYVPPRRGRAKWCQHIQVSLPSG
jgi:hypothetical protein